MPSIILLLASAPFLARGSWSAFAIGLLLLLLLLLLVLLLLLLFLQVSADFQRCQLHVVLMFGLWHFEMYRWDTAELVHAVNVPLFGYRARFCERYDGLHSSRNSLREFV